MKKYKVGYIIAAIALISGLVMFLANAKNITHNSLVAGDYVNDSVSKMQSNYSILGESFDSTTRELYSDIYKDDITSGNTALVGIIIAGLSILALIILVILSSRNKSFQEQEKQTKLLKEQSAKEEKSLEDKLKELLKLKDEHLISDSEYEELRKNAIQLESK